MATIIEMLLSTMTDEEKAIIRRKLAENPELIKDDSEAGNLLSIYKNEVAATSAAAAPVVPAATTPAATTPAPTVTPAPTSAAGDSSAQILAKLTSIESSLTTQIADLKKNAVTVDKLPQYREELLSLAIKTTDEIGQLRSRNQTELGKPLDLTAFEKFVNDSKVGGNPGYPTLTKAWESWTLQERTDKTIAAKVEEGIKTKTSAATVPGQTTTVALSPAQQVIAKARENAKGGTKSAAMAAADKMAAIVRQREEGTA